MPSMACGIVRPEGKCGKTNHNRKMEEVGKKDERANVRDYPKCRQEEGEEGAACWHLSASKQLPQLMDLALLLEVS